MPQIRSYPLPSFAKRLKRQRAATGLKQSALAHALGVNQATVSRWESGAQVPAPDLQQAALHHVATAKTEDMALKRLVESSHLPVHLIEDASHICLAYSKPRAKDWRASDRELYGVQLWQFATEEIRLAERSLTDHGWWDELMPAPRVVETSGAVFPELVISQGRILWERLYLGDGTPVRLVTGLGPGN